MPDAAGGGSGFWRGKKVLVPGGAGFIGSHVVDLLVARGAEVTVLDDLSSGSWQRLAGCVDAVRTIHGDATDPDLAAKVFPGMDVVMNLAGRAPGLTPDEDRHDRLYQENLRLGNAVLDAVIRHRVPRMLVVSSSCVYPDDAPVPTPEMPLDGTEPESANRGYGLAKRRIEETAIAAARRGDVEIAIARPFNVYGARDDRRGPGAHVIPSLLEKILSKDEEVVVWGSGSQTRAFIHGADAARGLVDLTEIHALAEPVNVGSPREIRLRDLAMDLMRLAGVEKPLRFDRSKPEGATRKAADISLLRGIAGGFAPSVDWEVGLEEIVRCHPDYRASKRGCNQTVPRL